jgi:hypothetical protein
MGKIKSKLSLGAVAILNLSFSFTAQAVSLGKAGSTDVSLVGYVKFDAMVSDYSDGTIPGGSIGRDFYVPSLTPVGGESESQTVDMHARQTRFALKTDSKIDDDVLGTYIELDSMTTPGGDERISNSYSPRVRHAYLTYNNWLFGQTWSTFMNVAALPDSLDFIGSTDATIFVRQSIIRYTSGGFQIAVENPETTVTPFGGGARIVTDDNGTPDLVLRYNLNAGEFSFVVAALIRQLAYNDGGLIDSTETSTGLSLSGKYTFGSDDIRFLLNSGSGMGRYIGLNVSNGAVLDANGELEAIDSTAWFVSYRHQWNDKWRSNVIYSAIEIDNDITLTGTGATASTESFRVNLIRSVTPSLNIGVELAHANRELESGLDGDMNRLQFSATLGF